KLHNNEAWYIGVDGGGTKTHAILVNQDLKQIDEAFSGPANIATDVEGAYISICEAVDSLLDRHNQQVKGIGIGVAGYSVTQNRNVLLTKLQKKYENVVLNSDCHIACLAAHKNKDGAIIICGTGVVAYSIYKGQTRQLGGWGFPHGDLGGGAYLGLEIASLLCKAIDGLILWNSTLNDVYTDFFEQDSHKCKMWLINAKPADYAKITQFIFSRPLDEFSNKLLEYGINEISELIVALKKSNTDLPLKLVGGLAKLYIDKLQEKYPELELSIVDPAFGAVLLQRPDIIKSVMY
ncbi:MAG TPA: BadF/BadG/BcrA/BcrD ATPase family protein, partial [Aquella sp.]|nr:BadF/BadG/BcrA/BcrD ATPase family protein [Aquella sp.]